jgi:hypothetical protein
MLTPHTKASSFAPRPPCTTMGQVPQAVLWDATTTKPLPNPCNSRDMSYCHTDGWWQISLPGTQAIPHFVPRIIGPRVSIVRNTRRGIIPTRKGGYQLFHVAVSGGWSRSYQFLARPCNSSRPGVHTVAAFCKSTISERCPLLCSHGSVRLRRSPARAGCRQVLPTLPRGRPGRREG